MYFCHFYIKLHSNCDTKYQSICSLGMHPSIMCLSMQDSGRDTAFLFISKEPFGIAGSCHACNYGAGNAITSPIIFMFVITECNPRAPQHGICVSNWWTNGKVTLHRERTVFINKQFPFHNILMCSQLLRRFLEILIYYISSHNFAASQFFPSTYLLPIIIHFSLLFTHFLPVFTSFTYGFSVTKAYTPNQLSKWQRSSTLKKLPELQIPSLIQNYANPWKYYSGPLVGKIGHKRSPCYIYHFLNFWICWPIFRTLGINVMDCRLLRHHTL
jgi:hypothetical protein